MIVLIAIATMIAATLAQHLGLAEAIARVVDKVASCPVFHFLGYNVGIALPRLRCLHIGTGGYCCGISVKLVCVVAAYPST